MIRSAALSHVRPFRSAASALAVTALACGGVVVAQAPPAHAQRCTITGTAGPDRLVGTGGNDVICGLGGDDVLISGGGREDLLLGGAGDDRLESSDSTYSRLEGNGGNDRLVGGSGKDGLVGGGGHDVLIGGAGADGLYGGGGDDDLDGEGGNDSLRWEVGADTLRGGSGRDVMSYAGAPHKVQVSLDGAADDGTSGEHDDVGDDIETVVGSLYADVLTGNGAANTLRGFNGADVVTGGGGGDTLTGDQDDDELYGEAGDDQITGGDSSDLLVGGEGADVLKGAGGNTQSNEDNACDDDPADTVTRCAVDSAPPTFLADLMADRVAPGGTVTFAEVRVDDAAGVPEVQLTTTLDGISVPWCSGIMDVVEEGPGRTAKVVNTVCTVPADAPEGAYEMTFSATDRLGFQGSSGDSPRRTGFMVDTVEDPAPPTVGTVSFSSPTYAPGDRVRVTVPTQDPDGVHYEYVTLVPPSGSQSCLDADTAFRSGGTMADGTWTFSCRLDATAETGTWSVDVQAGDTWDHTAFEQAVATFQVTG